MKSNMNINKNAVIVMAIVIISLFFAYKCLQLQDAKITSLKQAISEEEVKVDLLKSIESLTKKIDSYGKNLKKEDIKLIITKINNFASKTNIEIISIQPQKEEARENTYKALPINLNIKGTYHNIGKFINLLEGPSQFFNITNFDLGSGRGGYSYGEAGFEKKDAKLELLPCALVVECVYLG